MRFLCGSMILMLASVSSAVRAEETGDLKLLQGTWVAERVEADGKPVEQLRGARATIQGDKITVASGQTKATSTIVLRADRSPKEMDSTDETGQKTVAIYLVAGDTLQICAALPVQGAKRPEDFTTREADGRMLFVYKRAK